MNPFVSTFGESGGRSGRIISKAKVTAPHRHASLPAQQGH